MNCNVTQHKEGKARILLQSPCPPNEQIMLDSIVCASTNIDLTKKPSPELFFRLSDEETGDGGGV